MRARLLGLVAAAALASAVVPAVGATAHPHPSATTSPERAHPAPFTVFTNERSGMESVGSTPATDQFGATRATVVYDLYNLRCADTGCYALNGVDGALPSRQAYETQVRAYVDEFHGEATAPVVLDFESIVLTKLSGQAALHAFDLWRTLIRWTHEAVPGAPVGMYGYDWGTQNNDLTAKLHGPGLFDFFAPRAYLGPTQTIADWTSILERAVTNDRSLADQPIYPYVSPNYQPSGGWATSDQLHAMFDVLKRTADGAVIWEPSAKGAAACGWASAFSQEMSTLDHVSRDRGPLSTTVAAPSGDCTVPRLGTTSLTVTLTNTSDEATPATTLQYPYGVPLGVFGSWSDASVPTLKPGESWQTTLNLKVDARLTVSTVPIYVTTDLGTARRVVIPAAS